MIIIDQNKAEAIRLSLFKPLSKYQFNLCLYDKGLLDAVNSVLEANLRAKVEFDSASNIHRNSPTVTMIATQLGWSVDQVDLMWQEALNI